MHAHEIIPRMPPVQFLHCDTGLLDVPTGQNQVFGVQTQQFFCSLEPDPAVGTSHDDRLSRQVRPVPVLPPVYIQFQVI